MDSGGWLICRACSCFFLRYATFSVKAYSSASSLTSSHERIKGYDSSKTEGEQGSSVLTPLASNSELIAFAEQVGVHSVGPSVALEGAQRAWETASGVQVVADTVFLLCSCTQRI